MNAAALKSLVTHNLGLKALAICASFGLWYNIASEPELATIVSVPVDYKNFPKDLVISSNIIESVSVEARGPANRLREMQDSRVSAVIDFASVHAPGERTFTVADAELRPPRGVTMVRVIPEQLRFRFEHQTNGKLPVEVAWSGALPRGYSIAGVSINPPQLVVTGPESRVLVARKALTDSFDLTGVTTDTEQELTAFIGDSELRFASPPRVKVKVRVEKTR